MVRKVWWLAVLFAAVSIGLAWDPARAAPPGCSGCGIKDAGTEASGAICFHIDVKKLALQNGKCTPSGGACAESPCSLLYEIEVTKPATCGGRLCVKQNGSKVCTDGGSTSVTSGAGDVADWAAVDCGKLHSVQIQVGKASWTLFLECAPCIGIADPPK